MKILFTGSSSFTGFYFVQELAREGHEVVATFQKPREEYEGIRKERVEKLCRLCKPEWEVTFGSDRFLELIEKNSFDLFCHHAADVTHYKSPEFDVCRALKNNTYRLPDVLHALKETGCRKILLTGTVFEQNEGVGDGNLRAFSPYGLSKGLTSAMFRHYADVFGVKLGKFVIPNPFGPLEEMRFTSYLAKSWLEGKEANVLAPSYVRDNIHVSLLAKCYADFVKRLSDAPGFQKCAPSCYAESQGAFTRRFAEEMEKRLLIPCRFTLSCQKEFPEPRVRINSDSVSLDWDETKAWDELAEYYRNVFGHHCHAQ